MSVPDRHIEVTYCDDVREEVGGKSSYIGIYKGDMLVPSIPLILPKLCIVVNVVMPASDPSNELCVKVQKGEERVELISTGPMDVSKFATVQQETDESQESKFYVVQMVFMLSPFQIDEATILRVAAETEHGILKGRALRILKGKNVSESGVEIENCPEKSELNLTK